MNTAQIVHPHFVYTQEDSDAFLKMDCSGPRELTRELCQCSGYQRLATPCLDGRAKVFEYTWGLVTEQAEPKRGEWNFFIAAAWRGGIVACIGPYLDGWEDDTLDPIKQLMRKTSTGFVMNLDDPKTARAAAALCCKDPAEALKLARYWIANLFLPGLLPYAASRAVRSVRNAQFLRHLEFQHQEV